MSRLPTIPEHAPTPTPTPTPTPAPAPLPKAMEPHKLSQDFQAGRQLIAKMQNGALADPRRVAPGPLPVVAGGMDGWHGAVGGNRWLLGSGEPNHATGPLAFPDSQLSGNRSGVNYMQGFPTSGEHTTWLSAGYDNTGLGLALGETVIQTHENSVSLLGTGFGDGSTLGAGLGMGWVDALGMRASAAAVVVLIAGTELKALADPKAPMPQGRALTEWRSHAMPAVAVNFSGGWQLYGWGPRLAYTQHRGVTYRKFIDKAELAQALRSRAGQHLKPLQRAAEAVHLKRGAVRPPKLQALLCQAGEHPVLPQAGGHPMLPQASEHPMLRQAGEQALLPGESIRFSVCRSFTAGFNASAYGFRVGSFLTFAGDHDIEISRVDEATLQVQVAHKRMNSVSAAFDTLLLTESYHLSTWALGQSHTFQFKLDSEPARKAFDALLRDGKLPAVDAKLRFVRSQDDLEMATRLQHQALPEGVTWVHAERAERPETRYGAGVPKPFFMGGTFAGLSHFRFRADAVSVSAQPGSTARTQAHSTDKQTQLLARGTKSHSARGASVYTTGVDAPGAWHCDLTQVTLELKFKYDRFKPGAQKQLLRKLGVALNRTFSPFGEAAHGQEYEVTVRWPLPPAALQALASLDADEARTARQQAGAKRKPWEALRAVLNAPTQMRDIQPTAPKAAELTLYPASEALARYQANARTSGFGTLYRALEAHRNGVTVEVTSSSFADAMAPRLRDLQHAYAEASQPRDRKAGISACVKLDARMERGLRDVNGDAVLRGWDDAHRMGQLKNLGKLRVQLSQLRQKLATSA